MLAACAPYARWIDVFCERGAFDVDESRSVLTAGIAAGLLPRLHANQLTAGGGVQLAVELDAASADHCTHLSAADIDALAGSTTVATLLPLVEFSTRSPYPDARSLGRRSDGGAGHRLQSRLRLLHLDAAGHRAGRREMRMSPAEAVRAATVGGAKALRRNDIGRLAVGQRANLLVLDAPSYLHLAYRPGVPLIPGLAGRPAHSRHHDVI